jgi:hypothetical protein
MFTVLLMWLVLSPLFGMIFIALFRFSPGSQRPQSVASARSNPAESLQVST